jgi:hypothetical protein
MTNDNRTSWIYWAKGMSTGKYDPMEEFGEGPFPQFLVKRSFSYYADTIMHTAAINLFADVDNRMLYDFLRHGIRHRSRFAKWGKKNANEDIPLLMAHYGVNRGVATDYLRILNPDQIEAIRQEEKDKK